MTGMDEAKLAAFERRIADLEAQDMASRYVLLQLIFVSAASQPDDPNEFLKMMFESVSRHVDEGETILAGKPDMVAKVRHTIEHLFVTAGRMIDRL
ncbi:hypothetical protein [Shinella sp. BYT-45]|uniref:hypothetical protein n=1 Tax=Shinella sp. BYT-45 TaxID=3377377 RepID=UPI0039805EA7